MYIINYDYSVDIISDGCSTETYVDHSGKLSNRMPQNATGIAKVLLQKVSSIIVEEF